MTVTQEPKGKLPPIAVALRDLPERTKDFLIASSAKDEAPVADVMRNVLNRAADLAEFVPVQVTPKH